MKTSNQTISKERQAIILQREEELGIKVDDLIKALEPTTPIYYLDEDIVVDLSKKVIGTRCISLDAIFVNDCFSSSSMYFKLKNFGTHWDIQPDRLQAIADKIKKGKKYEKELKERNAPKNHRVR